MRLRGLFITPSMQPASGPTPAPAGQLDQRYDPPGDDPSWRPTSTSDMADSRRGGGTAAHGGREIRLPPRRALFHRRRAQARLGLRGSATTHPACRSVRRDGRRHLSHRVEGVAGAGDRDSGASGRFDGETHGWRPSGAGLRRRRRRRLRGSARRGASAEHDELRLSPLDGRGLDPRSTARQREPAMVARARGHVRARPAQQTPDRFVCGGSADRRARHPTTTPARQSLALVRSRDRGDPGRSQPRLAAGEWLSATRDVVRAWRAEATGRSPSFSNRLDCSRSCWPSPPASDSGS